MESKAHFYAPRFEAGAGAQQDTDAGAAEAAAPKTQPQAGVQRGLWFVQQLARESAAHNLVFAARVTSVVDIAALDAALHALIARHAALRTRFVIDDTGSPRQEVLPQVQADFAVIASAECDEQTLHARVLPRRAGPSTSRRRRCCACGSIIAAATAPCWCGRRITLRRTSGRSRSCSANFVSCMRHVPRGAWPPSCRWSPIIRTMCGSNTRRGAGSPPNGRGNTGAYISAVSCPSRISRVIIRGRPSSVIAANLWVFDSMRS